MADAAPEATAPAALPWSLQIGGDWQGATRLWTDLGCPYESATARSHADNANQQLAALQALGGTSARFLTGANRVGADSGQ